MSDLTLDHIVIAVRDLDEATADYEGLLGRRPSWRGEHPAYGTRNTLFRIDNTYIELLTLGGKGKDKRWVGELERFLDLRGDGLYALALGTDNIGETARTMRERRLPVVDPADGDGVNATSGARRSWRNAVLPPNATNGARLFFIEHRSPPDELPEAERVGEGDASITRMDHAVILSADMEASRRLWANQLGARLALDRTFPERNTRILFFRLGDITIEISGGAVQSQEGIGKPDRMWGVAWGVRSLEATTARLRDAGIETSGPRPGIKPGTLVATIKGPHTHGVATLLIEHLPESFRPESRAPHGAAFDNTQQQRAFSPRSLRSVQITTNDAAASAARWRATLGLTALGAGGDSAGVARLSTVRIDAGNTAIELVEARDPQHPAARSIAERGSGMFAIVVEVDHLDAAVADLRAKGVDVSDAEAPHLDGSRVAHIDRAAGNGVPIDLIESHREWLGA